ncbi:glycosyltransferase [Myxococcaceae bacterium GXIMD 01537]
MSPARPPRICHLGKFYPPASGGIETHVQTLARAQAALGASVEVLCINHAASEAGAGTHEFLGRTRTAVEQDGPVRVTRVGRVASVARLDVAPDLVLQLQRVLARGVDVLHLHGPNPTMALAVAALPRLPALVVTHHSDVIRQRLLGLAFAPVERLLYTRASLVLSDSEPYIGGSPLLRRFRRKVEVLPLGLDLEPFLQPAAPARERWRELGAPLWLMVGRLVYYKGLFTALEALREVPGKLLVVGVGPLRDEALARARALGVEDRVVWAGYLPPDELAGAFRAATALWFPSNARSESFGLSQVEAMASGCPVLNTAIPDSGVSWVSRHEESGLTVPVGDAPALAAAARRLLEEPGLRERLSRGAVARARSEFGHMLMAERSLALYERVLGARAGGRAREDSLGVGT